MRCGQGTDLGAAYALSKLVRRLRHITYVLSSWRTCTSATISPSQNARVIARTRFARPPALSPSCSRAPFSQRTLPRTPKRHLCLHA